MSRPTAAPPGSTCSLNYGVNASGVKAKPFVKHTAIPSTCRKGKITHRRDPDRCPLTPPSHFPLIAMLFSPPLPFTQCHLVSFPTFGPNRILTNPASHHLLPNPVVSLHLCYGLNYVPGKDILKSLPPVPQNVTKHADIIS